MGDVLQESPSLRVLDLAESNLGPASAPGIVVAVEMAPRLEELYLGWNPLQKGCEMVLRCLKNNLSNLHTVELQWTGLPAEDGGAGAPRAMVAARRHLPRLVRARPPGRVPDLASLLQHLVHICP